jgi:hypothetical protein
MTQDPLHQETPLTNDSYILSTLRNVERSSGSFMERSIVRGLFLGPPICLIACVILGNLLVLAGPHRAEAFSSSINTWTGVYGFFLGVFLGPIIDAIRKDKKAMEQALKDVVGRFNLSANDIDRVLRQHELQLPKTAGAFARLKKKHAL